MEDGRRKTEDRILKTENRRQKTEYRRQKTESPMLWQIIAELVENDKDL